MPIIDNRCVRVLSGGVILVARGIWEIGVYESRVTDTFVFVFVGALVLTAWGVAWLVDQTRLAVAPDDNPGLFIAGSLLIAAYFEPFGGLTDWLRTSAALVGVIFLLRGYSVQIERLRLAGKLSPCNLSDHPSHPYYVVGVCTMFAGFWRADVARLGIDISDHAQVGIIVVGVSIAAHGFLRYGRYEPEDGG